MLRNAKFWSIISITTVIHTFKIYPLFKHNPLLGVYQVFFSKSPLFPFREGQKYFFEICCFLVIGKLNKKINYFPHLIYLNSFLYHLYYNMHVFSTTTTLFISFGKLYFFVTVLVTDKNTSFSFV